MTPVSQVPIPWPGPEFVITFKTPRWKVLLLLAVSSALVALSVWLRSEKNGVIMSLGGGVFGLGALVACVHLHPRASFLTLKEGGFVFCSLFRSHEVRWADVQGFGVQKVGGNRMVAWNYAPEFSGQARGRRLALAMAGCEAALPDTYGFKAEELAAVMNQLRELHLAKTTSG